MSFNFKELQSTLPPKLHELFQENSALFGIAISSADKFKTWFDKSGTPFFKEYTDHTFAHSLQVFSSSCEIIAADAYDVLSSEDINILFLACIVHDAGLHLTEDMFYLLIDRANDKIIRPSFDTEIWPNLWDSFIAEAKRFNDKKLKSLLGDTAPISEPAKSATNLSNRDRMLIGEFLRRHHPRLAHEIAIGAVRGATGSALDLVAGLEPKLADLIGTVARSHGIALRATFDYLTENYDIREYRHIHIIFLMVLLRIADFLQIQSGRAPELFSQIHKIKSPFSANEWRVHQSISNITRTSFDPEAIEVTASPSEINAFLRVNSWLGDLQAELDISWAILGEIYGRFSKERLPQLKMDIRRIRSNLDDRRLPLQNLKFIPRRIKFSVDEPELLKLLLAPLYGDDPLYGLRELTQNSADSVKELEHLIRIGALGETQRLLNDCDIEIEINIHSTTFAIRDRGTGMNLDIIENYFLKAGASFRNSDAWRRHYLDDLGKSKISRAGRFGVGALAAFLIGDSLSVFTRHYSEKTGMGYKFNGTIDADALELTRERGPVGTIIQVLSSKQRLAPLVDYLHVRSDFENFYFIPGGLTVRYKIVDERNAENSLILKPQKYEEPDWLRIRGTSYERVMRKKYSGGRTYFGPNQDYRNEAKDGYLYCNDILVGRISRPDARLLVKPDYTKGYRPDTDGLFHLSEPTVAVTDNNGAMPLNLARTGLSAQDDSLVEALRISLMEEFVAESFMCRDEIITEMGVAWRPSVELVHIFGWSRFLFGKDGYTLFDFRLVKQLNASRIIVVHAGLNESFFRGALAGNDLIAIRNTNFQTTNKRDLLHHLRAGQDHWPLSTGYYEHGRIGVPDRRNWHGSHAVLLSIARDLLTSALTPQYIERNIESGRVVSTTNGKYLLYETGPQKSGDFTHLEALVQKMARSSAPSEAKRALTVWTIERHVEREPKEDSIASKTWLKSFTAVLLPYKKSRRADFVKAHSPISRFMRLAARASKKTDKPSSN